MRLLLFGIFMFVFAFASFAQEELSTKKDVEFINFNPDSGLPFSDAVRVGNILFLSGQIAFDREKGELVEGGIEAETKAVLTNIKSTLEKLGSSMDNVVKCTVVLADIKEWPAMNNVYTTFFKNFPARTSFAASGLALDARVEIECIAVVSE